MRIQIQTNLIDLRARLMEARAMLPTLLHEAATETGTMVVDELKAAAPQGKGESSIPGEASGFLADSFFVQDEAVSEDSITISVQTTQPQKLEYVRRGTGIYGPKGQRIRPTTKKALYWPDADHPVRSVRGMKPRDFVTPVLDNAPTSEEGMMLASDEFRAILEGA